MEHASNQDLKTRHWRGICLTDLQPGEEPIIKVLPHTLIPSALTGPVTGSDNTEGVAYTDASGTQRQTSVTTTNNIEASWIGDNINVYAPLVRKGEQVDLYQFSNMDKYFWKATGRDHQLRDKDRFRIEAAAANGTGQRKTDNNTYSITADPIAGIFLQKTSKKLGELCAWTWGALTKHGIFIISDDVNQNNNNPGSDATSRSTNNGAPNRFMIDSSKKMVMMNTSMNAVMRLQGQDGIVQVPRDLQIRAGRQIIIDAPLITVNLEKKGIIVINGENIGINASTMVHQVNTIGYSGNVKIGGALVSGNIRSPLYLHGAPNYTYQVPTIDVSSASGVANAPSADTQMDTTSGRSSVSWSEMNNAIVELCALLKTVAAAAGTSVDTSSVTANSTKSQITTIFGEK